MFDKEGYIKQWRKDNCEYLKRYRKQSYQSNKEREIEQAKQWKKDNPEKAEKIIKEYRKNNKERTRKYQRTWRQSKPGRESVLRDSSNRRRLGFIPLNVWFEGCEAHHISQNFVIYIPEEIHRSIQHCIWTWENMEQMNKLAISFL